MSYTATLLHNVRQKQHFFHSVISEINPKDTKRFAKYSGAIRKLNEEEKRLTLKLRIEGCPFEDIIREEHR